MKRKGADPYVNLVLQVLDPEIQRILNPSNKKEIEQVIESLDEGREGDRSYAELVNLAFGLKGLSQCSDVELGRKYGVSGNAIKDQLKVILDRLREPERKKRFNMFFCAGLLEESQQREGELRKEVEQLRRQLVAEQQRTWSHFTGRLDPEMTIDSLEGLSSLTRNCIKNADLTRLVLLIQKTGKELLKLPNFGRKCLSEVKEALAKVGLSLKE